MGTDIIIALITLSGVVITGVLAIVNTRLSKKAEKVKTLKVSNDNLEIENNIIERLIPVFEKKDFALDRIADILEQIVRRQELTEIEIKNFAALLDTRCEAPQLLKEVHSLQKACEKRKDRDKIMNILTEKEVNQGQEAEVKDDI